MPEAGRPGETPCHRKRQSPPGGCVSPWCHKGHWPAQQSYSVLLAEPLVQRDPQAPSRSTGWVGPAAAPCQLLKQLGPAWQGWWESCLPAAVPLRCHRCLAVLLLVLGTRSHHISPALLLRVLLLRTLQLTTACKPPL